MTSAVSHLPTPVSTNIMSEQQFQDTRNWLDKNGSRRIRLAADALKALEEMIELCYVSGAYIAEVDHIVQRETFKAMQRGEAAGHYQEEKVKEEVGDVSLCLAAFIQKASIDTVPVINTTLGKVEGREWGLDEFGILRRPDRNPHPYVDKDEGPDPKI